jgi:signal transduction histidine kinase
VLIVWPAEDGQPEIIGDPNVVAGKPAAILDFKTWLAPEVASDLNDALTALRERGDSFNIPITVDAGHEIEADGRAVGGRAVMRLRLVSGIAQQLVHISAEHRQLQSRIEALRVLVETVPAPIWTRNQAGELVFVNKSYADAVETNPANAIAQQMELLDQAAREELRHALTTGGFYAKRLPAVVASERRVLDVFGVPTETGSAAIALDATEAEALRAKMQRMLDAHRSTLDQLATAVAIFDAQRRLTFYNTAYVHLWDLDVGFLDQAPSDSQILEQLRASRRLPEQQDFRQWRTQLHEAYQAVDTRQYEWHLPDGRTLRVVTTPNSEGGVTYLFDDVTERLDLVRRYDALIRVQGETLDNLGEAVAVFGSDGRLRLSNPAFAQMWRLDAAELAERPHVETLIGRFRQLTRDETMLQELRASVTALEIRRPANLRIERVNGSILDCSAQPLPDGATLVTFIDITASVNVERALLEKNEALEAADDLKEAFLQHMSYELRSPLTNIIGFANLLGDPAFGALNDKQREYLGYITASTNALLAIINNILDLATIDAGAMTLNLGEVDIRACMEAAAEGVQDRLVKNDIRLDIRTPASIGSFVADDRRLRQVLFNLLSNAVGFSPAGQTVTLSAERQSEAVVFTVIDRGPGIPPAQKDKVFDWFETDPHGSEHRGPGLGLTLVRSFVELHGGSVTIESTPGEGTVVVCVFPASRQLTQSAA